MKVKVSASGLVWMLSLWGATLSGVASAQQTPGYYPYGYYQGAQPGSNPWAPRNDQATAARVPEAVDPAPTTQPAKEAKTKPIATAPVRAISPNIQGSSTVPQRTLLTPGMPAGPAQMGMPGGMGLVETRLGQVLANGLGRTLYVSDRETSGIPICDAACARYWKPFLVEGNGGMAAPFYVIPREDGSRQWSWSGRPLYLWIGDAFPGDVTGDGVNGIWHAVRL